MDIVKSILRSLGCRMLEHSTDKSPRSKLAFEIWPITSIRLSWISEWNDDSNSLVGGESDAGDLVSSSLNVKCDLSCVFKMLVIEGLQFRKCRLYVDSSLRPADIRELGLSGSFLKVQYSHWTEGPLS